MIQMINYQEMNHDFNQIEAIILPNENRINCAGLIGLVSTANLTVVCWGWFLHPTLQWFDGAGFYSQLPGYQCALGQVNFIR